MYADLHTHTIYSDGSLEIEELVKEAKDKKIKVLAVTDHDTIFHYDKVKAACEKYGIQYIRGVELSCYDFDVNKKVHIVGLGLNDNPKHVEEKAAQVLKGRDDYHKKLITILNNKGYDISYEDVKKYAKYNIVFKKHLFDAIADKYPQMNNPQKYRELFLNTGFSNADLEMNYITVKDGIEAIHEDGGIAIIAHPCLYKNYPEIDKYVEYGLDGIEISHPEMKEEDYYLTREIADKYNLIRSGGSDFHDNDLTPFLGDYGLTKEQFDTFKLGLNYND